MPDKHVHHWSEEARELEGESGYSLDRFYTSSSNEHDHSKQLRNLTIPKWLAALVHELVEFIPDYKNKSSAMVIDALVHRVQYLKEHIKDSKAREKFLSKLDFAIERLEHERLLAEFAEMGQYLDSTQAVLKVLETSGNWMLVTREIEKLAKNLDMGRLWEPYAEQAHAMIEEYQRKLRAAKK